MDDRIPGTDPPIAESHNVMNQLSSPAERRAFRRFHSRLNDSAEEPVDPEFAVELWMREHADDWRRRRALTAAELQAEEIRKHRWIESEKQHRDLGKAAHLDWVMHHAADWRYWFEHHCDDLLEESD
jgi:hypothetical protein